MFRTGVRKLFQVGNNTPEKIIQRGLGSRKTTQLKDMLKSPETEFLMEAHNGLSAKIVEEAGT